MRVSEAVALIISFFVFTTYPNRCAHLLLTPPNLLPILIKLFLAFLTRNGTARIAAVGHEPGLSELLSVCLYGGAAQGAFGFKKMGAALVTFGGTVSAGRGRLVWFLPPRLLRAAR